jgi:DNA-binding MarR family transcriptional regulator
MSDQDDVLRAFGDELLRLNRRKATVYPGARLDNSAFRILWMLSIDGPKTLRELSELLELEQSTVNRQVNAALGHGLLERFEVAGQASKLVRPTDAGREAYEHDGGLRAELLSIALDELGSQRARTMIEDLRIFNDAFDRARERMAAQPTEAVDSTP